MAYPNTLTIIFEISNRTTNDDAVSFEFTGNAIAIREMYARSGVLHHTADILPSSANQVRMEYVAHFHGQRGRWNLNLSKSRENAIKHLYESTKLKRLTKKLMNDFPEIGEKKLRKTC